MEIVPGVSVKNILYVCTYSLCYDFYYQSIYTFILEKPLSNLSNDEQN